MVVSNENFKHDRGTSIGCEDKIKWVYNGPHRFRMWDEESGKNITELDFQRGPVSEVGHNGWTELDLLEIITTRLEAFQKSDYACDENNAALNALYYAALCLQSRKSRRSLDNITGQPEPKTDSTENGIIFEPNKYYKHNAGQYIHVLNEYIDTYFYGRCFMAETDKGEYIPIGVGKDYGINYKEVPKEEWESLFDNNNLKEEETND